MKQKFLVFGIVLFIVSTFKLFSDNNLQIVFPVQVQQNISVTPAIKLTAPFPVDTSTLNYRFPYNRDTTIKELGTFSLIADDACDEYSDTAAYILSIPCHIYIEDLVNITVVPDRPLVFDQLYALKISNRMKLLKPDTTKPYGIDTVRTEPTTIRNFFRVINPLSLEYISLNDNQYVGCTEDISLRFNKEFTLDTSLLHSFIQIKKYGEIIEDTIDNSHSYEVENVNINISLGTDNKSLSIQPEEPYIQGSSYVLCIDYERITGFPNSKQYRDFEIPDKAIFRIKTIINDTSKRLPNNCYELMGWGDRIVKSGDTTNFIVPDITDDFYCNHWEFEEGFTNYTVNKNSLTIFPDCNSLKYLHHKQIKAVYEVIPIDTLRLSQPLAYNSQTGIFEPDPCSQIQVLNYSDSLGNSVYTYKRYDKKPLILNFTPCRDITFDHWDLTEFDDYHTYETPVPICTIINRNLPEIIDPSPGRNRNVGSFGQKDLPVVCTTGTYNVKIFKKAELSPNDQVMPADIFGQDGIKFNNVRVNLSGNSAEAFGSMQFPRGTSVNVTGTLDNPDYFIYIVYCTKPHHNWGIEDRYNPAQYMDRNNVNNMQLSTDQLNCETQINIYVRKKFYEISYKITQNQNRRVPSLQVFNIDLEPDPSLKINSTYEYFTSSLFGNRKITLPSKPINMIYQDSDGCNEIREITVTANYFTGDVVNLTPEMQIGQGYTFYQWNSDTEYASTPIVDQTNQTLQMTINQNSKKNTNPKISSAFMLEKIGVHKRRSESLGSMAWRFYTLAYDPSGTDLEYFDNSFEFDKGMGLLYRPTYHPEHIRPFHLFTSQIRFYFNQEVNSESVPNALKIYDGASGDPSKPKRHDDFKYTDYPIIFKDFNNPNLPSNTVLLHNNKTIEVTLMSHFGDDTERWMCHIQPFYIELQNIEGSTNRIKRAETDEYLSNLTTVQKPGLWKFITSLSGLHINTYQFINNKDDDDSWLCGSPDVFILGNSIVTTSKEQKVVNPPDYFEKDDEGRIVSKFKGFRYPGGEISDKVMDPGVDDSNDPDYPVLYDARAFEHLIQLKQGQKLDCLFQWVDNNESSEWEKIEEVLNSVIDAAPEIVYLITEDESAKELAKTIGEIAKKIINIIKIASKRDDRDMGIVLFHLERDDTPLMYLKWFLTNPIDKSYYWDSSLWGVGKGHMYVEVVSENGNIGGYQEIGCTGRWEDVNVKIRTKLKIILGDVDDLLEP